MKTNDLAQKSTDIANSVIQYVIYNWWIGLFTIYKDITEISVGNFAFGGNVFHLKFFSPFRSYSGRLWTGVKAENGKRNTNFYLEHINQEMCLPMFRSFIPPERLPAEWTSRIPFTSQEEYLIFLWMLNNLNNQMKRLSCTSMELRR